MLMSKNVNNDVSKDSPICVPIALHILHMKENRMMLTGFVRIFGYCCIKPFSCHI